MDLLDRLNKACNPKRNIKYRNWDSLKPGQYSVKYFKITSARFGLGLCAYIENFYVFLPPGALKEFNQDSEVEKLNERKYILNYDGKDQGDNPIISFTQENESDSEDDIDAPSTSQVKKSKRRK